MEPDLAMRCGLFGKLPAKRDFVTLSVPRGFLRVWEPWIEQGMSESRRQIGLADWKHVFGLAPIWRFWLGEDLCGRTIAGAFMPSMDACGRLFPVTLIGLAEVGEGLAPPIVDPLWAWFERAEALLRSTLDPTASCEGIRDALEGLARFAGARQAGRDAAICPFDEGARESHAAGALEHFQAKWMMLRVKKMRQNKGLEPLSESTDSESALDHDGFGSNRSKAIVIDSKGLERDAGGKPGATFPHPALGGMFGQLANGPREGPISSATFWWTLGGDGHEPLALKQRLMPAPMIFTGMLSTCFMPRPETSLQWG